MELESWIQRYTWKIVWYNHFFKSVSERKFSFLRWWGILNPPKHVCTWLVRLIFGRHVRVTSGRINGSFSSSTSASKFPSGSVLSGTISPNSICGNHVHVRVRIINLNENRGTEFSRAMDWLVDHPKNRRSVILSHCEVEGTRWCLSFRVGVVDRLVRAHGASPLTLTITCWVSCAIANEASASLTIASSSFSAIVALAAKWGKPFI